MKKNINLILVFILLISVGERTSLREEGWSTPKINFVYCGMISKDTFSIGNEVYRHSVNLYYPVDVQYINFKGIKIKILEVTPQYLKIDY